VSVVAVYPRPVVLRHSLPTYVCSFASPCTATATTDVLHCAPSSTVLRSTVPNVLWSPRSSNIVTMVTQAAGMSSSVSQDISEMTTASNDLVSPVSRFNHSQHTVQPALTSASSGASVLSESQQQTDHVSPMFVEDLVSELVASLPADIVKSLVESHSSQQTASMLLETLNVIQSGNIGLVDASAGQKLYNNPQLASIVKELFCSSTFEAAITEQDIDRWKYLAGLLQHAENKTIPFSSPQDFSQSELHVPACQAVRRSLGQLGHSPAHLEDQASNLHWYVFCMKLHTGSSMQIIQLIVARMLLT